MFRLHKFQILKTDKADRLEMRMSSVFPTLIYLKNRMHVIIFELPFLLWLAEVFSLLSVG